MCSWRAAFAVCLSFSRAGSAVPAAAALMASQLSFSIHFAISFRVFRGCFLIKVWIAMAVPSLVRHLGSLANSFKRGIAFVKNAWVVPRVPIPRVPQNTRNSLGLFTGASAGESWVSFVQRCHSFAGSFSACVVMASVKAWASSRFPLGPGRLLLATRYAARFLSLPVLRVSLIRAVRCSL